MIVELTDFKTKEKVDELEVDAVLVATGRAPYTQASPVTFSESEIGTHLESSQLCMIRTLGGTISTVHAVDKRNLLRLTRCPLGGETCVVNPGKCTRT